MIFGIYVTLGVFLMIASRDPMAHKSLIWFTVWSSFVHGAIMAVQSIADIRHIRHLWGDAPALIVIGAVLAALMPRRVTAGLITIRDLDSISAPLQNAMDQLRQVSQPFTRCRDLRLR